MKKIKPKYDHQGNMIMTDKIWKKLSLLDKVKLVFVLQSHGKIMVTE